MAVDGSLNFDTSIDTKGFSNGTKSISNSLGGLKSALGKVAVAVAAAFSVKQIIDFGKQSIETASDLTEVQNVVDTAFGSMSSKMEDFANTSIKQFGISRLEAKRTGSTFMAMASGMGLAQDSASDMAIALTGLSADMASFYNVEQDVASTALKSIFTGETETLKQFGIVMTDANLQAYALSQGISKSTSEMSQAEKVQLRYNYVMSQTALAQGDFAKTSDSWANQTRILSEQWKEFGATIGSVLMNVFLPAVKTINTILSKLIDFARAAALALSEVFGIDMSGSNSNGAGALSSDTADLADNAEQAADSYSDMADSAKKAQKANAQSLASFDEINAMSKNSDSSSSSSSGSPKSSGSLGGTISVNADSVLTSADKKLKKFFSDVKKSFSDLFTPLQAAWNRYGNGFVQSIKTAFKSILSLIKSIGSSFATVWNNGTGEKVVSNILQIFTNINGVIKNIADNIKNAWNKDNIGTSIVQGLADALNVVLDHIRNITKGLKEWSSKLDFSPALKSIKALVDALKPFADTVGKGLETFFNEVLQPMAKWTIEQAIPTFLKTLSDVISGISSVLDIAMPVIKDKLWDGFLKPIAKWTANAALKALETLGSLLKKLCESVTEQDVKVMIDIAAGIASIYAAIKIKSAIDQLPKKIAVLKDSVSGLITNLKEFGKTSVTAPKMPDMSGDAGKSGASAGLSFGSKLVAAIESFFVGWQIGSAIYDKWGEQIDSFMYPIYDGVVAVWDTVSNFITTTIPAFFSDLWDGIKSVFSSVGSFFKGIFTTAWKGIKTVWGNVKPFFSNVWTGIKAVFSSVVSFFKGAFSSAWNAIKNIWNGAKSFFNSVWNGIKAVFSAVISFFKSIFSGAWNGIKSVWNGVKSFFSGVWTGIKSVFSGVKNFFKSVFGGAVKGIKSVFGKIGDFFSGIWDGIASVFKGFINGIISGINLLIKGLNKLSIKIPDKKWVPSSWRGATIGFDIPEIPKLATGAVIPPNNEFLAVLGDQKRGTNIEAPLDTITQAVRIVMSDLMSAVGRNGDTYVFIDSEEISARIERRERTRNIRTGGRA